MGQLYTSVSEPRLTSVRQRASAFAAKMARRSAFAAGMAELILELLEEERFHATGDIVAPAQHRTSRCHLLVGGFAARVRVMESGKAAITQIALPGDFLDAASYLAPPSDDSFLAIGECFTRFVRHERLNTAFGAHPQLMRAFWLETAVEAAVQREWLARMGRQDALGRMAHFLCEIDARLDAAGLGSDRFAVPLTQLQLGDALGITSVHVSRVLKSLRDRGLVVWEQGHVTVLNRSSLQRLADFDPTYLDLGSAQT